MNGVGKNHFRQRKLGRNRLRVVDTKNSKKIQVVDHVDFDDDGRPLTLHFAVGCYYVLIGGITIQELQIAKGKKK